MGPNRSPERPSKIKPMDSQSEFYNPPKSFSRAINSRVSGVARSRASWTSPRRRAPVTAPQPGPV